MACLGGVVGPIVGGFIAGSVDVKYIFIVLGGLCGLASFIGIPFLPETYVPVIRMNLAKKSSDPEKAALALTPKKESLGHLLWFNLSRPFILITHSFICFILGLYPAM